MSHLPIKPVDHYLDQIKSKHVLFVGGITIILLVVFGPTLSDLLFNQQPATATKGGYFSDHYPDGILRYPTLDNFDATAPRLFSSEPFVVPPYQGDWLQGGSIQ